MKKLIAIILIITASILFGMATGCAPKYGCSATKGKIGYK